MKPRRLPAPRPAEVVDRTQTVSFTWNGQPRQGFMGDTITSALAANGDVVMSRSFKYHRPRGVMTADYWDPGCTVTVDGEPNVRGSHRRIKPKMAVTAQNVWPSLDRDAASVNDKLGRFLTAGFYYKTFMSPAPLWPLYEKVLSTFAPGGTVDLSAPARHCDHRFAHPDVVVVGAGPAGMAAALGAADKGADVLLVEHEPMLGGHLRWGSVADIAAGQELIRLVEGHPSIEVMVDSTVTGRYRDNWLAIDQRAGLPAGIDGRLVKARAKVMVVAAGLIERPYVFSGNDRIGVLMSQAARRLINLYGLAPGQRAVVLAANPEADAAVVDLESAGVEVVAVLDPRTTDSTISRIDGSGGRVERVVSNDGRSFEVDLCVVGGGWTAPTTLLNMAGIKPLLRDGSARYVAEPRLFPENVVACGGLVGDGDVPKLVAHAQATGAVAAERAAVTAYGWQRRTARAAEVGDAPPEPGPLPEPLSLDDHPALFRSDTHGMVDLTEDVSSADLVAAAGEGYDSIELMKRYTTVTMGPTQGKLETINAAAVLAEATGTDLATIGTTVFRPPYAPVALDVLAGRPHDPIRFSPLQEWHEANGAVPLIAGQWIRPDSYGAPAGEAASVRHGVGIIDVSPLGKLELTGPDVPKLLELLYVNKWQRLDVGRARYGVMCGDDGVVLDDGVTARLDNERYLMTTTSGGAGSVWEWVESWLQTEHPQWQVHCTAVTGQYASINVAGPASRELLSRVAIDVDLDNDAFPYMSVRSGSIALADGSGVGGGQILFLRIGFTGELSYELHVPARHGLEVWERLIEVGGDLGVTPFGVEAQRILRLEKGHLIVGQDTDGLTTAVSAGLSNMVKADKPDFVGKPELVASAELTERTPLLVALMTDDPAVVPPEASLVYDPTQPHPGLLGRVTSSRLSPNVDRSVILAQISAGWARPGTRVSIRMPDGSAIRAAVAQTLAQIDPEGERLRG